MKLLENKKILFFAPNSFGYENEIKKRLEDLGAKVLLFDERPSNSFLSKALIRLDKRKIRFYTDRYFCQIIDSVKGESFDYIFVLRGEAFSPNIMRKLKNAFPESTYLLYLWDSLRNNNTVDVIPFFDKVFSFDRIDAATNTSLIFHPLFYINDYKDIEFSEGENLKKVFFVGTVHSDRFLLIKSLEDILKKVNIQTDFYFFFQSKLLFYKKRLTDKSFRNATMKDFWFVPLKKEDLQKKLSKCNVIVDIQHPNQKGLTMRTIEALGARRKLITTNDEVKHYDFYDSDNIYIMSRDINDLNKDVSNLISFISSEYKHPSPEIYEKYSLNSWLKFIFSE